MTIRLREASVVRAGRRILSRVDLEIEQGRLTCILGPNGAGKSTLLRVCSGDLALDEGQVTIQGRSTSQWKVNELALHRAVLPQLSGLDFPFTVRQVARLGRLPHGDAATPSGQAIVEEALEALGLSARAEDGYTRLSGGERQRVHAARVLAQVGWGSARLTPWLLLDEPTSALDLVHQHRLMAKMVDVVSKGSGVVVVLHDPNLAARYADRVVLMANAEIVRAGHPNEVLQPGPLAEAYSVPIQVLRTPELDHPVVVAGQ